MPDHTQKQASKKVKEAKDAKPVIAATTTTTTATVVDKNTKTKINKKKK